jgi:hypothetical protein
VPSSIKPELRAWSRVSLRRASVAVVLSLAAGTVCASTLQASASTPGGAHVLITFRQEGGLRFQQRSLIVFAHHRATATISGRVVRFALSSPLWHKLTTALRQTNLHTLAGNYPPPPGAADEFIYIVTVGHDTIRAADGSVPRAAVPLINALREVLALGEHRATAKEQRRSF